MRIRPRGRRTLVASAVAGAALVAALPGAAGAQTAAPSAVRCVAQADATGIDVVLARARSPLAGQGATFVAEGVATGIDPRLLLAIAAHETGFETDPASRVIHNPFGLGPGMVFTSDAAAIARAARTLDAYYVQEGRIRIDTIGPKWAPIGAANDPEGLNRNWVPGVSAQFTALGGDPDASVLMGAQRATCPPAAAGAATAPAASDEKASGPAEVTTWGGAALMIALVGYLALRRRRVVAAAAARDPRAAWEHAPGADDRDGAPEGVAAAWAETAATTAPLALGDGAEEVEEVVEEADWEPGTDDPRELAADEPPADAAEDDAAEAGEIVAAAGETPLTPAEETGEAYWAWAEVACPALEEPAEEPQNWHLEAAADAEREPAAAGAPGIDEQAVVAADLVPALLDGLLPIDRVCDRADITPRMLAMMRIIADTPLPVTEQAERIGLPRTVVAGLCSRLEALGLAGREPLAGDARRRAVVLTPAGYELCADSAPALEPARVVAVLSRMTPAERTALLAGLTALASPSAG